MTPGDHPPSNEPLAGAVQAPPLATLQGRVATLESECTARHEALAARLAACDALVAANTSLHAQLERLRGDVEMLTLQIERGRSETSRALTDARIQGERVLALQRDREREAYITAGLHHVVAKHVRLVQEGQQREADLARRLQAAEAHLDQTRAQDSHLQAVLAATHASTSWRVTRPVRALTGLFRRARLDRP